MAVNYEGSRLEARDDSDELLIEQKRAGRIVEGVLSSVRIKDLFSLDELLARAGAGLSTPLDLMPHDYWHPTHPGTGEAYYPFGEKHLGAEF